MKPIRTVVIDDEPIGIEVIKTLVTEMATDLVIAGTATTGTDAVQTIASIKPDLIFLDIDLPYLNGIEVLQKLQNQSLQVIFTSGYGPQKFRLPSNLTFDWLTKPIDPEDFLTVVDRARKRICNLS